METNLFLQAIRHRNQHDNQVYALKLVEYHRVHSISLEGID